MRLAAAVVCTAVAATLAFGVSPARACSCGLPDPRAQLPFADAAFVGRLVSRREDGGKAVLVFDVERVVKGRLGPTVEVESASSGAACGIETRIGRRIGLLLRFAGGRWHGSLCGQVDPDELIVAAEPLPPPDGSGTAALLVGGGFGTAALLALDRSGRTLAYGASRGRIELLSACPGGTRSAEIAVGTDGPTLVVRALPSLRRVWTRRIPLPAGMAPGALRCRDRSGLIVDVFASEASGPTRARLVRMQPARSRTVWSGSATGVAFTATTTFVLAGRRGTTLLAVDAAGRATRRASVLPRIERLSVAPSGRLLAGVIPPNGAATALLVRISLTGGEAPLRTRSLGGPSTTAEIVWLGGGRLAAFPRGETADVRLFDAALQPQGRIRGWRGNGVAMVGTVAYGPGFDGTLVRAALPDGQVRFVRRLPGRAVTVIASVP